MVRSALTVARMASEDPIGVRQVLLLACKSKFACGYYEVDRHSKTIAHADSMRILGVRSVSVEDTMPSASVPEAASTQESFSTDLDADFDFNERVQIAEILFATFSVEHNIAPSIAPYMLNLFKTIGKEPAILQAMTVGKKKVMKLVDRVVSMVEADQITRTLRKKKFSVHVDETSDCTNDEWM